MSTLNKVYVYLIVIAFSGSTSAALTTADGLDASLTYDNSQVGLFGKPVITGDTSSFAPLSFSSSREGISGAENINSPFKVIITSLSPIKATTAPFPQTAFDGTGTWQANANAAFINPFSGEALIHNILVTKNAGLDGFASIKNTFTGLTAFVSAVPLNQAVWLFGAGLMSFLSITKRKKLL
ncbi:MAG: hypothetical protein PHY54_01910 [Methylococcales bacterium]|nr:hypothetical protein [Methylococcales bacterium]